MHVRNKKVNAVSYSTYYIYVQMRRTLIKVLSGNTLPYTTTGSKWIHYYQVGTHWRTQQRILDKWLRYRQTRWVSTPCWAAPVRRSCSELSSHDPLFRSHWLRSWWSPHPLCWGGTSSRGSWDCRPALAVWVCMCVYVCVCVGVGVRVYGVCVCVCVCGCGCACACVCVCMGCVCAHTCTCMVFEYAQTWCMLEPPIHTPLRGKACSTVLYCTLYMCYVLVMQ